ncbi:MAG: hypothetical protein L6R39_004969 [Caloplaca ligustica]|nr:MAG: hypothetical protein L6R39_004969 [Caloplaca ligustica]
MEAPEHILLEFDHEELARLATHDGWGHFRTTLKDIEMVAVAREFLPQGHSTKAGLQDTICRSLGKVDSLYCSRPPEHQLLCADQLRLLNLYTTFVWSALRSEAIDNSVVEATIWKAFLSHNQTIRLGPRNELGHESKHPAVRSEDGERGEDPWFKVTVETIRTHEKAFNDVCVEFIHDPVVNTLNVQVPEEAPTSGSSNSDVCHGHLDFVLHTQSKGHVQLQFITGTSILLVDISLHPSQGEALIRQLGTIAGAEPIE